MLYFSASDKSEADAPETGSGKKEGLTPAVKRQCVSSLDGVKNISITRKQKVMVLGVIYCCIKSYFIIFRHFFNLLSFERIN